MHGAYLKLTAPPLDILEHPQELNCMQSLAAETAIREHRSPKKIPVMIFLHPILASIVF